MTALFIVTRAIHYASALVLLGELLFAVAIASSGWRDAARSAGTPSARIFRTMIWSLVIGLASGAIWFAIEASVMSGAPLRSIDRSIIGTMWTDTTFGRVWTMRAGFVVALFALGVAIRESSRARIRVLIGAATLVAAAYVASLAWTGHAAAGEGAEEAVQKIADVVHLLAAGAWLGSLPALVDTLGPTHPREVAARAARRFSLLGLISVSALIASGFVNTWYQVGGIPPLVGTLYGRLLVLKLALFVAMIVIAIVNRGILAPRVAEDDQARRALRRNALVEIALGLGIVVVVGRLGVTVPAAHERVVWPFAHTLSMLALEQSAWIQLVLAAAGIVAVVAVIFLLVGVLKRPPRVRLGTVGALAMPAGVFTWLLVTPAHPTTYASSPVGYTTTAVAAGAALYASHCSGCHGHDGRGEASANPSSARPGDLAERIRERRGGDLYWSIAHGVPGSAMPGFLSRLTENEIWSLIAFLDAQSAARNAGAMTERVTPIPPVPAPDFTYELAGGTQRSLVDPRDERVTLLVFYTLPASLDRLIDLATHLRSYTDAGARVIAIANGDPSAEATKQIPGGEAFVAATGADVAAAYALFAQRPGSSSAPIEHVEYLIDRQNELRARWIGIPGADRGAQSLAQIRILMREERRPVPQWGHRH